MKYLITTITAVMLVGCSKPAAPNISLYKAAEKENIEAVKQHIAAGTDINQNSFNASPALYIASLEGHYEIAKLLLANVADVNLGFTVPEVNGVALSPLDSSTSMGHDKISDLLRQNGGKHGSIYGAVEADNYEAAKGLIEAGANVNLTKFGYTALDKAIFSQNTNIADLLRKHGAKTGDELKAEGK